MHLANCLLLEAVQEKADVPWELEPHHRLLTTASRRRGTEIGEGAMYI